MSYAEIADSIGVVGYIAAFLGLGLSIMVLVIRFRERNIARSQEQMETAVNTVSSEEKGPPVASPPPSSPPSNSIFKTYTPK